MDLGNPLAVLTPTVDADVLTVLAGSKGAFTGRQVHRIAGNRSERGVRDALLRLSGQGIVHSERVGHAVQYRLNREHLAAPHIEALTQLRRRLLERISTAVATWNPPAEFVALFGSAARGDMRPDSDIDLFVVRSDYVDADQENWQQQLASLTERVTAWTGNDARILELAAGEISRGSTTLRVVQDIRDDGIVLFGPRTYLS